ncbi:MAG: ATP-binding protein [bacterium]|nr:ATP-binding protein [bacterium]
MHQELPPVRRTYLRPRERPEGPSPWLVEFRERVDGYIAEIEEGQETEAAERGVTVADLPDLWEHEAAKEAARKTRTRTEIQGEIREMFGGNYAHMTLDTFEPQTEAQRTAMSGAREWIRAYAESVAALGPRPSDGALFFGRNRRGKTHLAVGMLREITSPLVTIRFANVPVFLDEMRQSFREGPGSRAGVLLQQCLDADVLVLDDLGQERPTEWVIDTLGHLVFRRHSKGLPIIVTTNMSIAEINNRADGRDNAAGVNLGAIYSRLREMCLDHAYYFDGEDFHAGNTT